MSKQINNSEKECSVCGCKIKKQKNKDINYEVIENGKFKIVCFECYKLVMGEDYWS